MDTDRSVPNALLVTGAACIALSLVTDGVELMTGELGHDSLPWLLVVILPTFVIAAVTYRAQPDHPSARRLVAAAAMLAIGEFVGTVQGVLGYAGAHAVWMALAHHLTVAATVIAIVRLIALYPDGVAECRGETRFLRGVWAILLIPPLLTISYPTVIGPSFETDLPTVANPVLIDALAPLGRAVYPLLFASQAMVIVAIGFVVARYRRGDDGRRARIRWLLVPAVAVVGVLGLDLLGSLTPAVDLGGLTSALWLVILPAWTAAMAFGLTGQRRLTVDLVLRRSLVYGALWTLIAVAYVGLAASLGLLAVDRLPIEAAIVTTILATIAFQPLRRWMEGFADRWVFGERLGRYESMRRLGHALEEGMDLRDLPPRLAATLRDGLGMVAVRVVVPTTDPESGRHREIVGRAGEEADGGAGAPDVTLPIIQGGETLGRIECVTAADRPLDDTDRELLTELARQSGLAIRNLRLTRELEETITSLRRRTAELQRSRAQLVRAQDEERRRLERDLHDGVQQHIVATIAQVGLARRHAERDPTAVPETLATLQRELGAILDELRELARGVHPSLLTAGGLVAAVEAQTARSPVPVEVHADPDLREQRYAPELEGAAYFMVTEGLANVLKHADATTAEVSLRRRNGSLRIAVRDDGRGFDPAVTRGIGLRNLAGRIEALGGDLAIDSEPGGGTTITARLAIDAETPSHE